MPAVINSCSLRNRNARREKSRRAFSLLELTAVVFILGLIATMAVTNFGHDTLTVTEGSGFARCLLMDLRQARQRTITTGDDHSVQFTSSGGAIASYTVMQDTGGGAVAVERTVDVPRGVTVTASPSWEFDFEGTLTAGSGVIQIDGATDRWTITVYTATGAAKLVKTALP